MRHLNLRTAIASTLALSAGGAFALPPASIDSSVVNLYVSGATATDNAFENMARLTTGGYCQVDANAAHDGTNTTTTLDIYYVKTKTNSGSTLQRVMFCNAASGISNVAAGTKIAVFKESRGGSANGIIFPARNASLPFIDFYSGSANIAAACSARTYTPASGDLGGYWVHNCGAGTDVASTVNEINVTPNAGISDIDPQTFVGLGGVAASDNTALTRKRPSVGVTFNPIVSKPLYLALQKAQGLVSSGATQPDDSSIDKMPSLPASTLRAIFTGNIINGNKIYTNGTQLTSSSTPIFICRRGNTSGTMTSFKILFLGEGCSKNSASIASFVGPDDSQGAGCESGGCPWDASLYGQDGGDDGVFAGSGSGDVRACMTYRSGTGQYAVGVASTESKPGANDWRYIKVDGQEPTLQAVMEGRYSYFTENSFNDRGTSSFPSTGVLGVWDFIYSNIGNKTVLAKINESWRNAAAIARSDAGNSTDGVADTGILDIPAPPSNAPTFPVTSNQVRTNPVNGQARTQPSAAANNCNTSYMRTP